ncbi:MAG: hypothetical protein FD152_3300 [Xanthobacteraceae bacterium]|nr:MAG: hypothetical protein FD152_3300 [Xanthobacteraceae bacterium]
MTASGAALAAGYVLLAMSLVMTGAFFVERRTGNSGWIDVTWTFGLGVVGGIGALLPFAEAPMGRRLLVAALAAAWALRLGLHIASRTRGITDDPRYAAMRLSYGDNVAAGMFRLLQIQAVAAMPLGLAIILAAHRPGPLGTMDIIGVAVFAAGIVGGGLSDRQLRDFAADPAHRGRVCDVGLWRYSRHPNYFFECVLWASFAVIALQPVAYPTGLLALLAPLTMTMLLTKISGIPPLEDHMVRKYGEAYRAYQARTSAFVPLPRRAGA